MLKIKLNKIVFTGLPILEICNEKLVEYLKDKKFEKDITYTIQSGDNGIFIENNQIILETIYVSQHPIQIERLFQTFHQNDDNVRLIIYDYIYNQIGSKSISNLLLIGGECYIYGKIIKSDMTDIYTDFESILIDAKRNCKDKNNISFNLIDYKDYKDFKKDYDVCIVNIGKKEMIDTFKINSKLLLYISCHQNEIFKNYKVVDCLNINKINIYKLEFNLF